MFRVLQKGAPILKQSTDFSTNLSLQRTSHLIVTFIRHIPLLRNHPSFLIQIGKFRKRPPPVADHSRGLLPQRPCTGSLAETVKIFILYSNSPG
jgi:hypothetical protein